jgi:hypothetical protein
MASHPNGTSGDMRRRAALPAFAITVCFFILILFANQVGFFVLLATSQLLVILIIASLLCNNVPTSLLKVSRDNCFRINGSLSQRRHWLEQRAFFKVYSNFFATLVLVALAGNLLALWIDSSILPLQIAKETISLFSPDPQAWRDRISYANLDAEYSNWRFTGEDTNLELANGSSFVKSAFPVIFGIAFFWFVFSGILLLKTYRITLFQFELGVRMRNKEYVDRDIGQLQSHRDFAMVQHN